MATDLTAQWLTAIVWVIIETNQLVIKKNFLKIQTLTHHCKAIILQ